MPGESQIAAGGVMPKVYWIARVDVHDPETYKLYVEAAAPAFARHNAKVLARGGKTHPLEGPARSRNVVMEFASMEEALACYNSPEYTKAREYRHQASTGELILVEGV
jgi:uncharacterized protein (DUF1330 family)